MGCKSHNMVIGGVQTALWGAKVHDLWCATHKLAYGYNQICRSIIAKSEFSAKGRYTVWGMGGASLLGIFIVDGKGTVH